MTAVIASTSGSSGMGHRPFRRITIAVGQASCHDLLSSRSAISLIIWTLFPTMNSIMESLHWTPVVR